MKEGKAYRIGMNTELRYIRIEWNGAKTTGRADAFIPSRDAAIQRTIRKYGTALKNLAE
jgi:hypothetical protein